MANYDPDMRLKTIRNDGTPLLVKSSEIGTMINSGEIVAYQCSEGWKELRRKENIEFQGPDRRHIRAYLNW